MAWSDPAKWTPRSVGIAGAWIDNVSTLPAAVVNGIAQNLQHLYGLVGTPHSLYDGVKRLLKSGDGIRLTLDDDTSTITVDADAAVSDQNIDFLRPETEPGDVAPSRHAAARGLATIQDEVRADKQRADSLRPEWTHQLQVEPAGVADQAALPRRYVLRFGEPVDVPAPTRFLAVFTADRAYRQFSDVAVGADAIPFDARLPPARVPVTIPQAAVAGRVVRSSSGSWLPMAIDFLDGAGRVLEAKSVRFFVDVDPVAYRGGLDAADLPPWATIAARPDTVDAADLPPHIDMILTERIGDRTIAAAALAVAGQTDGVDLDPSTPTAAVSDRGRLRFGLTAALRDRLEQNLADEDDVGVELTLRLSDGAQHVHRGIIIVT